jgi:Cu-Zn family superoxide dismutase
MTMRTLAAGLFACALLAAGSVGMRPALAAPPMYEADIVNPAGKVIGSATFIGVDTGGVQITVDVTGLTPGLHGMHIHEFGSCNRLTDVNGVVTPFGAAGGHFDPQGTGHHAGPDGMGHAGDLPMINVSLVGHGRITFYDSRFSVLPGPTNIVGRSIVIHANPDNFTDTPPNGGSGARVACGEIDAPKVQ